MAEINFLETSSDKIYNSIITALENGVAEPLYPGDERRIFGEALVPVIVAVANSCNDACRQKLLRYARGETLDAIGETFAVKRLISQKAKTVLRFSVSSPVESNITISAGTRCTSDFERYFETLTAAVIPAGDLFVDVPAQAEKGGSEYNDIRIGDINNLTDLIPYLDTVSNTTRTDGGNSTETDDAYRERIRLAPNKKSTAGAASSYRYWAMQADSGIADVVVTSPAPSEVEIIPIMYGGKMPSEELLNKVLKICSAENVRPLTDKVKVKSPTQQSYNISLIYYTTASDESDCVETIEGSGGAIDKYVYWQDSQINHDINPDMLTKLILAPEEGIGAKRVVITEPVFTDLPSTTVAHFSGNLTVTHKVVEGL